MRAFGLSAFGYIRAVVFQVQAELRRHALLHVMSLSSLIVAMGGSWILEIPFRSVVVFTILAVMAVLGATLVLVPLLFLKFRDLLRGDFASPFVPEFLYRNALAPDRIARFVHVLVAMVIVQLSYNIIKRSIPVIHPFAFDRRLADLDRWLHFGVDPYRLLMPLIGTPVVTYGLAFAYHFWFTVMTVFWVWQALSDKDDGIRFLLAFMLLWIVGSGGLGTILSSVGPCYFTKLFPGDPLFEPLMTYLAQASAVFPISTLTIQDALWNGQMTGTGLVHGISAMPSMHVGTSVLFALAAPRRSVLRKLLAAFAVVIFIGSIQLGWHYAVDGYVAAGLALLFWKVAGILVGWDRGRWPAGHALRFKGALKTPVVAHADA